MRNRAIVIQHSRVTMAIQDFQGGDPEGRRGATN